VLYHRPAEIFWFRGKGGQGDPRGGPRPQLSKKATSSTKIVGAADNHQKKKVDAKGADERSV